MLRRTWTYCAVLILIVGCQQAHGQGIVLPWAGAVNSGMGGASTAAPLDALGATYWNPATTSGLENELSVGLGFLVPVLETRSSITGLASGSSKSDAGSTALPSFGFVFRHEGSALTYSLGVAPVAGFGVNYAASGDNPIFLPQSNAPGAPGGFGRVFTRASFLQIAPSVTLAVNEKLSVAIGPTITTGEVVIDPMILGPLDDSDGSGQPRYGPGRGTRFGWGGGAQIGVYYITDNFWHFGASIKSPQWMEEMRVRSTDELGRPTSVRFKTDLPMIISLGTAYSGFENVILALDVRYFDNKNTDGLGDSGFAPNGALRGLDMSSVFAVATGVQYRVTESFYVRMGYSFNQSPFQSAETTYAVAAPIYYQHAINAGASIALADRVWISASYSYSPTARLTGPIQTPLGPVPGSSVTTEEQIHAAQFGITLKY